MLVCSKTATKKKKNLSWFPPKNLSKKVVFILLESFLTNKAANINLESLNSSYF